jgi:hypothetical protein
MGASDAGKKVYPCASVAAPFGVVTVTSTVPAGWLVGNLQIRSVPGPLTAMFVQATPPTVTPVAPVSPTPTSVSGPPPVWGPLTGVTAMMLGVTFTD